MFHSKVNIMQYLTILLNGLLCVNCYNINVNNVFIYTKPKDNVTRRGTYFGYSVILQKKWVQIGAPRGNSTHFGNSVMEPGVVYRCEVEGSCRQVTLDYIGNEGRSSIRSVKDNKNYSWIGVSMDVEDRENGKVVVCGHRWKNQQNRFEDNSHAISGLCYYSTNHYADIYSQTFDILLPEEVYSNTPFDHFSYAGVLKDSQIGISISIAHQAQDKISLLIGAPGAGPFWAGGVVQYQSEVSESVASRRRRDVNNQVFRNYQQLMFIHKGTYSYMKQFTYFGYQVSSGFFFRRGQLNYVSSSPRGADLKGFVLIYNIEYNSDRPYVNASDRLEGNKIGEYFGASLAVADVDGDGLDELIVGSPLFSLKGDEGCIYIFSKHIGYKLQEIGTRKGFQAGGRFGASVASLGDIDQDYFEDIAVASPYEGNGVIYVYNGCPGGLKPGYSQRIKASDINPSLRGFGISISRPTDIDGNKYNDFAVGSYLSEHVVLFKTYPTIELKANLSSIRELQLNDSKFLVEACIKFFGSNAPRNIEIVRTLDIDVDFHRFEPVPKKNMILKVNDSFQCETITIRKKDKLEDSTFDGMEDVKITLSQELELDVMQMKNSSGSGDSDKFCALCPVLRNSHRAAITIPYSQECDGGDCVSDVVLNCELLQENNSSMSIHGTYIIGSKPVVILLVNLSNYGHVLYGGGIQIEIPKEVNLAQIPFACQENYNNSLTVYCKFGAIKDKVMKQINISLDLSAFEKLRDLWEGGRHLSFHVSTTSLRNHVEENEANNKCDLKLNLKMDADVQIHGKSDKEWYTYENRELNAEEPRDEPTIIHTYEVSNVGISPIREVQSVFYIPTQWNSYGSRIEFTALSFEAFQNTKPVLCFSPETKDSLEAVFKGQDLSLVKETKVNIGNLSYNHPLNRTFFLNCSSLYIKCQPFLCNFAEFKSNTHVKLVISMTLNVSLLEPLMGQKDIVYFSTYGHVKIVEAKNRYSSEEKFHLSIVSSPVIGSVPKEQVAIWIIIVCVIAGILLILLVVASLIKAGFFKREKKEELKALKESDHSVQE